MLKQCGYQVNTSDAFRERPEIEGIRDVCSFVVKTGLRIQLQNKYSKKATSAANI